MISGAEIPIDLEDLKNNTVYDGAYKGGQHITIQCFWHCLESSSNEDRRKFLKFVTSCPRQPLLGFKELEPKFCIRDAGDDIERVCK
jgi:ubiquitin-protein ligase E3 C